jgi:hypothetical protein
MTNRTLPHLALALTTTALAACQITSIGGGSTGSGTSTGSGASTSSASAGGGGSEGPTSSSVTGSGGSGPTTATSGAGGSAPGGAFQLVGAYWTGSAEAVDRIDPLTGAGTFVGNLGDLQFWSTQLVLDHDATHVHAVGMPASKVPTLYVLNLASGVSTQAPIAHSYTLGGVTDDGHTIGVYWTGAAEAVDLIDPVTGTSTFAGNLGDLQTWSNALAYDHVAHVIHAIGNDAAKVSHLYGLSLDTHASTKVPIASGYFLGGVTPAGAILGAFWTGTFEQVDEIDPATGLGTAHGQLGDLEMWSNGSLAYDTTTNVAYALGMTATKAPKVYTLDLATQVSAGVPTTTQAHVLARP